MMRALHPKADWALRKEAGQSRDVGVSRIAQREEELREYAGSKDLD